MDIEYKFPFVVKCNYKKANKIYKKIKCTDTDKLKPYMDLTKPFKIKCTPKQADLVHAKIKCIDVLPTEHFQIREINLHKKYWFEFEKDHWFFENKKKETCIDLTYKIKDFLKTYIWI